MLSLSDYLHAGLIEPNLRGGTKKEVLDELLDVLRRNGLIANMEQARQAVWKREEGMSTGLQYGVAIPHGKCDAVNRLVCAVGIHRKGIDFDAMDHQPSTIFFLTLSPVGKPAPHVQFMSTISQILNSSGRERILACRSADEIYDALTQPPRRRAVRGALPARFRLADYLSPDLLTPALRGRTKTEVIDELLDLLRTRELIADHRVAREAVLAREDQMSTGMAEGVAIPHGRTDAVDRLVCAVGVKASGVDFGSADGKPTQIIVLALTPTHGGDPYLQFAAAIVGALDEPGREKVLAARTPEDLYAALMGKEDA